MPDIPEDNEINETEVCVSEWECSSWSNCISREKTRDCIDLNNCEISHSIVKLKVMVYR